MRICSQSKKSVLFNSNSCTSVLVFDYDSIEFEATPMIRWPVQDTCHIVIVCFIIELHFHQSPPNLPPISPQSPPNL